VGIDEDPVTGSAHCCLGPYWSQRLGKTELVAYQASVRGGIVGMTIAGGGCDSAASGHVMVAELVFG